MILLGKDDAVCLVSGVWMPSQKSTTEENQVMLLIFSGDHVNNHAASRQKKLRHFHAKHR